MTRYVKQTLIAASAVLALTATAASAQTFANDFAALDADNNGQVSFAEFSAVAKTNGLTTTAAAQHFTRMSAGDAIITAEEHSLALAFHDQPYALQNINGQNINNDANVSYVSSAPEFEPPVSEVQDAPVADAKPIVTDKAPAPEVEVIREPVPEMTEPTVTATEPEVTFEPMAPEMPETGDVEIKVPEAEDSGDVLLEEDPEPMPEG